jgi:thiol:disulfide interchange protein DsbD
MKVSPSIVLFVTAAISAGGFARPALPQEDSSSKVRMSLVVDRANVEPGSKLRLAVILDHDPYWHTYAHRSAAAEEQGMITVDVKATPDPSQLAVHSDLIGWPESHQMDVNYGAPATLDVYEGRAVVFIPITVETAAAKGPVNIPVTARVQTCDDETCLAPADLAQTITINIVSLSQAQTTSDYPEIFRAFPEKAWDLLVTLRRADHPHEDDPTPVILIVAVGVTILVVAFVWMKYAR